MSPILQYGPFRAENRAGEPIPVELRITAGGFQVQLPKEDDPYPLTIQATLTSLRPASIQGLSLTPDWTAETDEAYDWFGSSVGSAGDVNGDGYSDVIVGAPYDHGGLDGRVFVYHGSANGLNTEPDWTAENDQTYTYFGGSVGTAGDVNGDGYADVIIGAPSSHDGAGEAFIYHGSSNGLSASPNWRVQATTTFAFFGYSVGTAGDVNGDGFSDIIVGAPYYSNGDEGEGVVFVYHGSATGVGTTAVWMKEGNQLGAELGNAVGTAGDVNGDGYSDVIIGARNYSSTQFYPGKAYVYHGSSTGLKSFPAWTVEGEQGSAEFSFSVGTAGDVNGDGYSDVIIGARATTATARRKKDGYLFIMGVPQAWSTS